MAPDYLSLWSVGWFKCDVVVDPLVKWVRPSFDPNRTAIAKKSQFTAPSFHRPAAAALIKPPPPAHAVSWLAAEGIDARGRRLLRFQRCPAPRSPPLLSQPPHPP